MPPFASAFVGRVYGLDAFAFFCVTVGLGTQVIVICGAGQPASLQEMSERIIPAQFMDDTGPIPNISAFSSWSRAFNFFK